MAENDETRSHRFRHPLTRRSFLVALGATAVMPLLAACGGSAPAPPGTPSATSSAASSISSAASSVAARATTGGSRPLVFAYGTDAGKLDAPAGPTGQEGYIVNSNIYDSLVRFKAGTTEVVPALAEQ